VVSGGILPVERLIFLGDSQLLSKTAKYNRQEMSNLIIKQIVEKIDARLKTGSF